MSRERAGATVEAWRNLRPPASNVALVEAHLLRYAVSCPLCKAVDQLGVGQHTCSIASANGAKDSVTAIIVVCKRCGYLMPLAADQVAPAEEKAA